jgi:response regulator of citrate/malate metabolism
MDLTITELLDAIFAAKRLEDLQSQVRAAMIDRLIKPCETPVVQQKHCRIPAGSPVFPGG